MESTGSLVGLTSYQAIRIRQLSHAAAIERSFRDAHRERGPVISVRVFHPSGLEKLEIDEQFLRGMRRCVFALYMDLVNDGQGDAARKILEQVWKA